MTEKAMLPKETLEKLVGEPDSGIIKEKRTFHVALNPKYLGNINLGLVNHMNKLIGIYNSKFDGILAGYGKLLLKSTEGAVMNESPFIHLDIISDFLIFRPKVGGLLSGVVSKKSSTHVSCLVHGCFNVPCYKPDDKTDWFGKNVQLNQVVRFTLIKLDTHQRVPFMIGNLQEESGSPVFAENQVVEALDSKKWSKMAKKIVFDDDEPNTKDNDVTQNESSLSTINEKKTNDELISSPVKKSKKKKKDKDNELSKTEVSSPKKVKMTPKKGNQVSNNTSVKDEKNHKKKSSKDDTTSSEEDQISKETTNHNVASTSLADSLLLKLENKMAPTKSKKKKKDKRKSLLD